MSGAEAIAVLGVISSVIAIVDGLKKVYDTVKDEKGLPKAFSVVADQLLTVRGILKSAKSHIKGDGGEDACKEMQKIIDDCEKKAETLDKLFRKIVPKNGALGIERYWKAVKAYGKGNEVENLMKGIMEDVQLLACEKGMKTATEDQQKQILKAIQELSDVEPSVPENEFQEMGFSANNYGYGTQNVTQGKYTAQDTARQYNAPGGTMNFGNQPIFNGGIGNANFFQGPEKDEALDCLAALRLTNPKHDRADLIQTKGSRVDGTCKWIKTNELYKSWLHSESQLLWLSGGPGKGKTMLSIFLAEELEKSTLAMENALLLQYFCDNKDEKRNTAVAILRGLVFQLLQKHQELYCHILPSFRLLKKSLFENSSFRELWDVFKKMVCDPVLGITYCILDGLDECDEASSEELLMEFKTLFSTKSSESSAFLLHLIVVSRDHPDFIPDMLSNFPRIQLDPDAESEVNGDIRQFIKVKVNELAGSKKYPTKLSEHVKGVFLNRAQGTFLWVGIVAQALTKYKTTEVEKVLELFPSGLKQLYARMLLQIDDSRRETAAKILRWVVLAVRPLTILELSAAIGTTDRSSMGFSLESVIKDQVSFCGDFLKIREHKKRRRHGVFSEYEERKEQEVGLIHQSAKDYLLRETKDSNHKLEFFRVKKDMGNLEIARKCLDCLQNGALLSDQNDSKAFPLNSYAGFHWPEHARLVASPEDIFDLGHQFYQKKSLLREAWLREYWRVKETGLVPSSFTLLHFASYLGIVPLAKNLLLKESFIDWIKPFKSNKDSNGMTALHWASKKGHKAVVQLLLEKGADIKAKNGHGMIALYSAAKMGHTAVVQLLLENEADIKEKNDNMTIALYWGALSGHTAVVQLLLDNRADVNAKNSEALHLAAIKGHIAVVQLLLEKGVDIKAKNQYGEMPIQGAAKNGNIAVVQLLLENGADVDPEDSTIISILYAAVTKENEATVQLLLKKGVDVNTKVSIGTKPRILLHQATVRGHKAIVRLLLENGANIEENGFDGMTALHWAAEKGYEAVVQLLLEHGADVNAEDIYGNTALHGAAYKGYEAVVRLLLEYRADIKAEYIYRFTALHGAAKGRYKAVVQLLLEHGTNVKAEQTYGMTELHWAAKGGHQAVLQLLLENGADFKAKGISEMAVLHWAANQGHEAVVQLMLADLKPKDIVGMIALHEAAKGGHKAVLQLLLENGADIERKDSNGMTALHWAAEGKLSRAAEKLSTAAKPDHKAAVQLLLEKGADIQVKDNSGMTALHSAIEKGREPLVRLLLEKGANAEVKDSYGMTALYHATWMGHNAVVQLLLEKGADIEAKCSNGSTALQWARLSGNFELVRILKGEPVDGNEDLSDIVSCASCRVRE